MTRAPRLAGAAVFVYLAATSPLVGIGWDEGTLRYAGDRRLAWCLGLAEAPAEALEAGRFRAAWGLDWAESVNPPLWPLVYATARAATGGLLGDVAGGRSPAWLAAAALAASFVRLAGPRVGPWVALALLATPRLAGHAHFAALDLPFAAAWWFAVRPFLAGEPSWTRRSAVASGAALGLAAATKISGGVLAAAWIVSALLRRPPGRWTRRAVVAAAATGAGLLLPLLVPPFLLLDHIVALPRLIQANTFYLGRSWLDRPPWHYPWAYLLATTPVLVLVLAAVGARRNVVAVANALALPAALSLPWAPVYDADRLILAAYPFVSLLAAEGLAAALERVRARRALAVGAGAYAAATLALATPHPVAYSNEAIGGASGAWRAGLEVAYWGDALGRPFWRRVPAAERYHPTALGENAHPAPGGAGWAPAGRWTTGQAPPADAEVWVLHYRRGLIGPDVAAALPRWRFVHVERAGGAPLAAILVPR